MQPSLINDPAQGDSIFWQFEAETVFSWSSEPADANGSATLAWVWVAGEMREVTMVEVLSDEQVRCWAEVDLPLLATLWHNGSV